MKVLIGCEFSGTVRDAFIAKGHDAMSCDLLPTDKPGPHYQGNVLDLIGGGAGIWRSSIRHARIWQSAAHDGSRINRKNRKRHWSLFGSCSMRLYNALRLRILSALSQVESGSQIRLFILGNSVMANKRRRACG